MLFGSYYVNTLDKVIPRVTDTDFLKTRDNLGEYYFKEHQKIKNIYDLPVKEYELAKTWNEDEQGLKECQFSDLKENPLGSVQNILFWNDQQKEIYTRVMKRQHSLLMGDYGTGRVAMPLSSALIILYTGKTLILEAAAKTLSERDDDDTQVQVVFISALGEAKNN